MEQKLRICDVDPLIQWYEVVCNGRTIGKKVNGLYERPAQRANFTEIPWNERKYKGKPPWFSREIEKIGICGGTIRIWVKEVRKNG